MRIGCKQYGMCLTLLACLHGAAISQDNPPGGNAVVPASAPGTGNAVPPTGNAAIVNGEVITEAAVQRELRFAEPEDLPKLRPAIVNNLVDLLLIDQYLRAAKIDAPAAEVDARLKKMQEEAKAQGNLDLKQLLAKLGVTEGELRTLVTADLRWENFLRGQADDAKLEQFFNANKIMFDGSQVNGRHILVACKSDATAAEKSAAQAKLRGIKAEITKRAAELAAKTDPSAEAAVKENAKRLALETAFGDCAAKESDCPSKRNGGDLGWFPRVGRMVDAFAAAAFALEPGSMSDIVETQFGCHLILVSQKMAGKEVKFAEMKEQVRDVYGERLKQVMAPQLRQRAQITLAQASVAAPEASSSPAGAGK